MSDDRVPELDWLVLTLTDTLREHRAAGEKTAALNVTVHLALDKLWIAMYPGPLVENTMQLRAIRGHTVLAAAVGEIGDATDVTALAHELRRQLGEASA